MPPFRPSTWRRIAVAVLANAGLLVGLEAGLRLAGRTFDEAPLQLREAGNEVFDVTGKSLYRLHPDLFWELRPGSCDPWAGDELRSTFRGPLPAREPPPSTFRVALLGDSCTYGVALAYEQTYGARLEQFLSALYPDRRIEIINGGVPGYTLYQGSIALREKVLPFEPDAAVFYFGWNDSEAAYGLPDTDRAEADLPGAFLGRFAAYRMLRCWVQGKVDPTDFGAVSQAWIAGHSPYGNRVSVEDFEALLDEALALCASNRIQPIVVLPEYNWHFIGTWQEQHVELRRELSASYRERMEQATRRRGVPTVDMRHLFQGRCSELFLPGDPVHPNADGDLLLGGALADLIREAGWVERIEPGAGAPRRPLRCRALSLTGEGRVSLELDAGQARARAAYFVWPALSAGEPAQGCPLAPDGLLRALRGDPKTAQRLGYLGRLDGDGRTVAEVTVPPGIGAGRMLGFTFTTGTDELEVLAAESGFSNDVWVRVDHPARGAPAAFMMEEPGALASPDLLRR